MKQLITHTHNYTSKQNCWHYLSRTEPHDSARNQPEQPSRLVPMKKDPSPGKQKRQEQPAWFKSCWSSLAWSSTITAPFNGGEVSPPGAGLRLRSSDFQPQGSASAKVSDLEVLRHCTKPATRIPCLLIPKPSPPAAALPVPQTTQKLRPLRRAGAGLHFCQDHLGALPRCSVRAVRGPLCGHDGLPSN